mmetsp:Transcript_7361/g.22435  ORF Transcript_7361/g.22435 Transcript_7361/m.22435 type:complete len:188 (+) Transcript_7361:220-783(+)|eukprot:CAMPEP_0198727302 /NCGR_PEP_ID=MMETSP1475-20131203/4067_1 /TAXON_ID= ORGANISM="Unidentified sp., Strain CCMP1999" /NCGR_SAMPLE_ID=MMETSP1475 /ASSEMBLY_ACC=CAM_ASM_001111 /LENGTH=187 /DNA_ID=CAMNT_0044489319 /DNA_START=174 /DNA_END=737 /DNA_ORIENTATION=-
MSGLNRDTSVPQPCVTGCGYTGTAENMSMCSKCYHEHQRQEQNRVGTVDSENRSKDVVDRKPLPASSVIKATEDKIDLSAVSDVVIEAKDMASSVKELAAPVTLKRKAAEVENEAVPKPKVQKNINRCFSCRKRIGLSNFKCRCGYHYCAEHRYSDSHNCSFDYKTFNKAILAKENPIIKAAKVSKI